MTDTTCATCATCGWWAECDDGVSGYCDSGTSLWGGKLTTRSGTCDQWEAVIDELIIPACDSCNWHAECASGKVGCDGQTLPPAKTPLIYIAGPYAASVLRTLEANIRVARAAAEYVLAAGGYPVTPHLLTGGMEDIPGMPRRPDEYYYAATLELLRRCDAVLLLPDWRQSRGAVAEHAEAQRLGLPVYDWDQGGLYGLADWIEELGR